MKILLAACVFILVQAGTLPGGGADVERFAVFEVVLEDAAEYANPYTELEASATLTCPDNSTRTLPLFWDGDDRWKLRISPDVVGHWSFTIRSRDKGLDRRTGSFECVSSHRRGSIEPMPKAPRHFQYQDGTPMWFLGDTAWALLTDGAEERHDRAAAETYLRTRADQGFNVVHSHLLSEAGWGNSGGPPFRDLSTGQINPAYFQEVDRRVIYANEQGIVVGLALAWGDKGRQEPFAWRRFPDVEARQRFARYIAARYGAYHVYFLVSGEWHAEIRTRSSTEADVRQEFIAIGDALAAANVHRRMIGIHPMTRHGSVREFNEAGWMSFGDYQQNYQDLHGRLLESRQFGKPVVNAEYGYHLRDQNGDGTPDKDNSTSLESIRHASWDIVMAGGYLVTGFGTTYFGGHRDPGPFQIDAPQNDDWERQVALIKRLFAEIDWWQLEPHDDWLTCSVPRNNDGRQLDRVAPPKSTYWLLAEPGRHYIAYARGVADELHVHLGPDHGGEYRASLFNPRTGEMAPLAGPRNVESEFRWMPPDSQDWILHLADTRDDEPDRGD